MTVLDPRLTAARVFDMRDVEPEIARTFLHLLDFAEERLRVNVGLLSENDVLKRRLADLERGSGSQEGSRRTTA